MESSELIDLIVQAIKPCIYAMCATVIWFWSKPEKLVSRPFRHKCKSHQVEMAVQRVPSISITKSILHKISSCMKYCNISAPGSIIAYVNTSHQQQSAAKTRLLLHVIQESWKALFALAKVAKFMHKRIRPCNTEHLLDYSECTW